MKKTAVTVFLPLLVLLSVLLLACPVFAEDSVVTYYGIRDGFTFEPGSGYTDTDLFDELKGVMPGDRLTEEITIRNLARDCDYIKLYMRAEIHDEADNPLRPGVAATGETVATMSDFLSQLSMRVYQGSRLIYEESPDAPDGLSHNVYLGTFKRGETSGLTVQLDVPYELGNEYQHRTGEVDWVFAVEAFDYPTPPPSVDTALTVHKIWSQDNPDMRPERVVVRLLKNGERYADVELNEDNQWTYTWDRLSARQNWSVTEPDVPEGYEVSYDIRGSLIIVTNTWIEPEPEPLPEEPEPEEPLPQPGEPEPEEPVPSPVEPDVPEPEEPVRSPVSLTVRKVWSGDEAILDKRPVSVGVTLFNGDLAVETVYLSAGNAWTFTWNNLDPDGKWSVLEIEIPEKYTPSYRAERTAEGSVVTITNTASLIQTGQLNWPVPFLLLPGILLVILGILLMKRKKKERDHA